MAGTSRPSAFVTGADSPLGTELVTVLKNRGHHVIGLVPSREAAERVRRAGGVPVIGDLLSPGRWQDETGSDWVFHLPPAVLCGHRVAGRRADALGRGRLSMDRLLLDTLSSSGTKRILYVTDTSCYGATGSRPVTEDEPLRLSRWGRALGPALDRLDGYIVAGLPIVTALPGWIYGDVSWFRRRVIEPVMTGRRVWQFGRTGPWVSPIHVHDCARALVHVARHGESGGRYFLVNNEPIRLPEFARTFARLVDRPLRVWRVPAATARWLVGDALADLIRADAVFSNIRLRGTGFRFRYPTLERGLQQVIGELHV